MTTADASQPSGTTVSISVECRNILDSFTSGEEAPFGEQIQAFRFAFSLSLYANRDTVPAEEPASARQTTFNIGSLDSDGTLRKALELLAPESFNSMPATRLIRHHGEWGLHKMASMFEANGGEFDIAEAIVAIKGEYGVDQ